MVVVMEYAGGENDEDMFITILRTMMMVVVEYAGGVLMARGGWSGAIFVEHRLVRGRSSNHSIFVFVFIFSPFLLNIARSPIKVRSK